LLKQWQYTPFSAKASLIYAGMRGLDKLPVSEASEYNFLVRNVSHYSFSGLPLQKAQNFNLLKYFLQ
jgi:hypothetical protein